LAFLCRPAGHAKNVSIKIFAERLGGYGNMQAAESSLIEALHSFFVVRFDCYGVQLDKGGYVKVEEPLTSEVLAGHLKGNITVGTYQLNGDSFVKWLCFDLDPEKLTDPEQAVEKIINVCFEKRKEDDGVERPRIWPSAVLLEASRYPDPSYHIWIFFAIPVHAKVARWLGLRILELAELNPRQVEVFPKQSEINNERSFGNLVKLPLGFHRAEKKWSRLLDPKTFELLPNEALLNCWGISFSEASLAKILSFEDKKHIQATLSLPQNYKPLKSKEEEQAVKFLAKYWRKGNRNQLELAFLGFCIKKGVSRDSARRIIERVCELTNDEEKAARLRLVEYHYQNRRGLGVRLVGKSWIREVVKGVC
jgi:hypothetical protein